MGRAEVARGPCRRPGCRLVSPGPLQGDLFEAFVSGALQSPEVDLIVGMAERAHVRDGAGLRTEELVEGGSPAEAEAAAGYALASLVVAESRERRA